MLLKMNDLTQSHFFANDFQWNCFNLSKTSYKKVNCHNNDKIDQTW